MLTKNVFIILPGFTMDKTGVKPIVDKFKLYYPDSKYIVLNPPFRKVTIYNNKRYRTWYDYYTNYCNKEECINTDQLKESRNKLHDLIKKESKLVNTKNIYLIGYSQGACMALDAGLTYEKKLGGIIGIKGHIPSKTFEDLQCRQNILVSHGKKDKTIGFNVAEKSYKRINKQKYNITFLKQTTNHSIISGLNQLLVQCNDFIK